MKYTSTRDASKRYSFEDALCSGYAPDGGLFVPQNLPDRIQTARLKKWALLAYVDLATEVLSLFLSVNEISKKELHSIVTASLSSFEVPSVVPVKAIPSHKADQECKSLFMVELFHGPTFCFKDLSLQFVVQMLKYFAHKRDRNITLVVATTGDTGPAAVQAVEDCQSDKLGILVHYPQGQISDFQRKQLTTCANKKIQIVAFQGGGDDMDAPIKRITTDTAFSQSKERLICGVNSYNIARPLMQMVHFIWAYLRVTEELNIEPGDPDFKLDVVLPTGAMGNMAGGYMAKKMGIPLGILCAGVNANDVTHQTFQTGIVKRPEEMHTTLSEAINIQLPYNLERLLFYLTNQDHNQVKAWYAELEEEEPRKMVLKDTKWFALLQEEFRSARVTDEELCATLMSVLNELNYWADPNTGVAFCAAKKLHYCLQKEQEQQSNKVVALLATASPCKFESVLTQALGDDRWESYVQTKFPARGWDILSKPERPPIVYEAIPGKDLQENQVDWERATRKLIHSL